VGDTALKLAERSSVATLLVRREAEQPYGHVVGCAKAVPADRSVIDWAHRLSPAHLIHIVSAYTVPYEARLREWGASQELLDHYAEREHEERTRRLSALLIEFGLPAARARLHVEHGDALAIILRHAAQWQADLLIVGRRAQANPLSGEFGSIARQIAYLTPTDVIIVPPPPAAQTR
jgi:nucleotide-binding universal stress UspA family protein